MPANGRGKGIVFGLAGLFILGFTYRVFPRFRHSALARPAVASSTLAPMLASILPVAARHVLAPQWPAALGRPAI